MNGMETLVVGRSLGRTLMWFLAAFLLAPLGAGYALGLFGSVEVPGRILGWFAVLCSVLGMVRMGRQLLVGLPDAAVRRYVKPGMDGRMSRLNKGIPITFIGLDRSFDEVYETIKHWHAAAERA